jgi:Fungal specific transcription factor domain
VFQYEKFWDDPLQASIMWLGLLFAMICLANVACSTACPNPYFEGDDSVVGFYREKVVQCLTLGEYTKPGRYNLEALYNYLVIEYSIRSDASKDIWVLMGILINLAMQMGYHRDPSHFPDISPLIGETRRRAWVTLLQGDILISTQMGMPRIIKECQCDTSEPRNLNDSDFDEKTQDFVTSRPETEITNSSQMIARRRLFMALGKIVDLTVAVHPHSYAEVMKIDGILQDAETALPAPFRFKSIGSAVIDPPQIIMHRLFLRLMFHKGQIMLHRNYRGIVSDEEDGYAYSRKSCLEAVLGVLEIQRILDEETNPNGNLHPLRWKLSSFIKHEFLTATMVLCQISQYGLETLNEILECDQEHVISALKGAYGIWNRLSQSSSEARIASEALRVVLKKNDVTDLPMQVDKDLTFSQIDYGEISLNPGKSEGLFQQ